jgi:hypothetical protein
MLGLKESDHVQEKLLGGQRVRPGARWSQVQGTFAAKLAACQACEFYQMVRREEGGALLPTSELLKRTA